jgi:olfactory receptor
MILLLLCLIIGSGNIVIMTLIIIDSHLHSMYFLLANLSFVDMWLSSVSTPKMITDFLKDNKTISFGGCMSKIFFAYFIAAGGMVLLVVMAYDHYMAICKPLQYSSIISLKQYIKLVLISRTIGFVHAMNHLVVIVHLPFCGPWEIPLVSSVTYHR